MHTLTIHIDCEFTDFTNMGLISIGAVAEQTNDEFYAEVSDHKPHWRSKFVNEVVMPFSDMSKFGRPHKQVAMDWATWVDGLDCENVLVVADYSGDFELLYELHKMHQPKKPIRTELYNSYLGNKLVQRTGKDTLEQYLNVCNDCAYIMAEEFNQPGVRRHHALDDARVNMIALTKAIKKANS